MPDGKKLEIEKSEVVPARGSDNSGGEDLGGEFEGLKVGDKIQIKDLDLDAIIHQIKPSDFTKYKKSSGKIGKVVKKKSEDVIEVEVDGVGTIEIESTEFEKINESIDITELSSDMNLDEYFLALEAMVNKIEFSGGKPKMQKLAQAPGMRVERGKRGGSRTKVMGARERAKRALAAQKGNMKAKAKGKLAAGNKKKIIGQKLNPNSPTK